jgi:protein gp37
MDGGSVMGAITGIEWTDSTWSPIRVRVRHDAVQIAREKGYTSLVPIAERMAGHVGQHCEHVSPGCEHCYAETIQRRCLPANGTGMPYDRRSRDLVEAFVDEKILLQPLKWGGKRWYDADDGTLAKIERRKIFVENQSDLFGEWVTDEMLDRVFAVMALCPQHIFQVLTKRPERMRKYLADPDVQDRVAGAISPFDIEAVIRLESYADRSHLRGADGVLASVFSRWPLPHVWLGVSVENQATADERIPLLLETPAAIRFVSAEPLLGMLDLSLFVEVRHEDEYGERGLKAENPDQSRAVKQTGLPMHDPWVSPLDWVIAGGESGKNARPMHPDWARSLRDQCVAAGVPFFFKQWGEWQEADGPRCRAILDGNHSSDRFLNEDGTVRECALKPSPYFFSKVRRVGKKAAGSLLDGREWKEFPEVSHAR